MIHEEMDLSKSGEMKNTKKEISASYEEEESKSDRNEGVRKISGERILNSENSDLKKLKELSKQRSSRRYSKNAFHSNLDNNNPEDDDFFIEKEDLTCRQKVDRFLSYNNRLFYIKLIVNIIAFISFIFYVVTTYKNNLCKLMNIIDIGICTIFILEHVINAILSHHTLLYLISLESLINFTTEIPPLFSMMCKDYYLDNFYRFINVCRVIRLLRVYRIIDLLSGEKDAKLQIINIIMTVLFVIFLWAGVMQIAELGDVENNLKITFGTLSRNNLKLRKDYHHYVYFIIVSITTVGYGEIMPNTILGKFLIVLLVVVILVVVPDQTNELINLSNAQTIYERRSYKASNDISHIVLMGEIDLDSLKSFCDEYFHKDHGNQYRHAIILRNESPSKEMELFLNEKENNQFLIYLQGNPMDDGDLLRCDILKAKACIIFTNKNSKDPFSGDHQCLLSALYVKKFYYNTIKVNNPVDNFKDHHQFKICFQLNKPESSSYYYNTLQSVYKKKMDQDQILVIEALKMNLLSKSCLTPGIIALLSNLVMSSGSEKNGNDPEWLKEYAEGRQYEIYRVPIQDDLLKLNFRELCAEIYNKFQGIAIALEINYNGKNIIKLNPQETESIIDILDRAYTSEQNITGNLFKNNNNKSFPKASIYVICSGKEIVEGIARLDHSKENEEEHFKSRKNSQILTNLLKYNKLTINKIKKPNDVSSNENENENENSDIFDEDDETFNKILNNDQENLLDDTDDVYENYYTLDKVEDNYFYSNEIIHQSIKDRDDIINHVIICGMHPEIIHFILPLRAKYLPENHLKWIVILAPSLSQELHDALSKFPKIIFIQGNPLQPENLFRANITSADIAVILSSGQSDNSEIDVDIPDAGTIFIYKALKKMNKNIKIMTELLITKNIEFLLTAKQLKKLFVRNRKKDMQEKDIPPQYEHTSVYAIGEVYLPSLIDKLTCQTFYNPNILTILNLILSGESLKKDKEMEKLFNLTGSNLFLILNDCKNESYSDMFNRLVMNKGIIPIALYRKNITENFYYVYTNPKKTTLIRDTDLIFILSTTENMLALLEKSLLLANNNITYVINKDSIKEEKTVPSLFKIIEDHIEKDTGINNMKIPQKTERNQKQKPTLVQLINTYKRTDSEKKPTLNNSGNNNNNLNDTFKRDERKMTFRKKPETSKYIEIDSLQNRLNNVMDKLQKISDKCDEIKDDINKYVLEEINSELLMYISKTDSN